MIQTYDNETEQKMRVVFERLSERDRRMYAAIEATKLPRGGHRYIASVLGCTNKTIHQGIKDMENNLSADRIRRPGGGRKLILDSSPGIDRAFLGILSNYTAGDPMNQSILWTNLTHKEIAERLTEQGFKVGANIAKQLLKKHGYVKRKAQKQKPIGSSENRNEQFENIARLRKEYEKSGNPVVSIDTKKKSL